VKRLSSFSATDGPVGREVGQTPSAADIAVRRLLRLHDWHSSLGVMRPDQRRESDCGLAGGALRAACASGDAHAAIPHF